MRTSSETKRALCAIALVLSIAACSGSTPAGPRSAASAPTPTTAIRRPAAPIDELVSTDRGRMHLRCAGSGPTTVLLIAGWGDDGSNWPAVESGLSRRARVCSYTRFGLGDSDPPRGIQTFETQAADLHALLAAAGEPGPYVAVGHSFGGGQAVMFAHRHPDEVDAVVLVDASPPTWPQTVCSVPEYRDLCNTMKDPARDPERLDVFGAFDSVAEIASLGDLPMTVMTAEHRNHPGLSDARLAMLDRAWAEGVDRWAGLSEASRIQTVAGTGHHIEIDAPAAVVSAITEHLEGGGLEWTDSRAATRGS